MIVSHEVLMIFAYAMVIAIAAGWAGWSIIDLSRLWENRKEKHDKFFGAIIGLLLALTGLVGLFKHWFFPAG